MDATVIHTDTRAGFVTVVVFAGGAVVRLPGWVASDAAVPMAAAMLMQN